MKAVILAGGQGKRLSSVTHGAIPKPMAEILGRPVLEHIVRHLAACGFTELCCTLACLLLVIQEKASGFRSCWIRSALFLARCCCIW